MRCSAAGLSLRRFRRARAGAVAVELAIVGSMYFLVLMFAVEGGIFYLKIDTLDLATERASRLIIINRIATAPATAAAFTAAIASNSNGVLQAGNISVSVQMAAPVTGTSANPVGGFESLGTAFTAGTFQYVPGACTVTTTGVTVVVSACTGACAYPSVLGALDTGYQTTTSGRTSTIRTYTCSAGQDILVQVQYTDTTLTKFVSSFFGPVVATLAFQAEPSLS